MLSSPTPGAMIRRSEGKAVRYLASCSFGKDSLATVLLARLHGEPLDEVIYCEVMFDRGISGEIPEHRAFIYETAIPRLESWGIPVTVVRDPTTYIDNVARQIKRGPKAGMIRGFPPCGRCAIQRDCKARPISRYLRAQQGDVVQYIGIAKDEQRRLLRLEGQKVSLLEKYGIDEAGAYQLCKRAGLLSPIYTFADRNGCFFCPNAKLTELRHLRRYHPDLWARLLQLQALPNKPSEKFNRAMTLYDMEKILSTENKLERKKSTWKLTASGN